MGWGQSKQSKTTKQSQRKDKLVKKRVEKKGVELFDTAQLSIGASSHGHDLQPPTSRAVVETEKKVPTVTDTSEPHTATTTQSLPLSGQGEANDKAETVMTRELGKILSESCPKSLQPPVQPVNTDRPSEATTTPSAIGTVSGSHCEEQAVVEVEEKKLSIIADTSKSYSTSTEASREDDKEHKGISGDRQQRPRAQDESDHVSKKPVRKKRHKRTRRHGE